MPIDPSIPLNAGRGVTQMNPLQNLLQVSVMRNNMLQGAALNQQINANVAASQAYKAAIDPTTGALDQNKFASLMAQGPGAYNLPTYLKNSQDLANSQLTFQTNAQKLAKTRAESVAQAGVSLLSNPNATGSDYLNTLSGMLKNGVIDAQTYANTVQAISPNIGNPQALRGQLTGMLANLPPEIQQKYALPTMSTINTGGQTNIVATNPITGAPNITGTIKNSMTPGEAATPVPYFNTTTGTPSVMTKSQFAQTGAPETGTGVNGGVATAPALGQPEIAKAAADRYNALTQSAGEAPIAISGYNRALDALNALSGNLGTGGTGPGADTAHLITGALNALGAQVGPDDTANYQTLKKYLANAAAQAASASGYAGSDARLDAFEHGQPNASTMNPDALRGAIQYVKALQQGVIAKNNAAQAYLQAHGGNTATLPAFETQWSNAFTPDVMEYRNMTPDQMQTYVKGLSPSELTSFKQSYSKMAALGAF